MLKTLVLTTALALPVASAAMAQDSQPMPQAPAPPGPDSLAERIGDTVHSPTGEPLGELTGVVGGEGAERAVVSYGGVLGLGDTEVVVPPEQLSIQPGGEGGQPRLVLSMGEDELQALPEYDPEQEQQAAELTQPTAPAEPAPAAGAEGSPDGLGTEAEQAVNDALARVERAWAEVETATSDGWASARENFRQAVTDLERTWDEVTAEDTQAEAPAD